MDSCVVANHFFAAFPLIRGQPIFSKWLHNQCDRYANIFICILDTPPEKSVNIGRCTFEKIIVFTLCQIENVESAAMSALLFIFIAVVPAVPGWHCHGVFGGGEVGGNVIKEPSMDINFAVG